MKGLCCSKKAVQSNINEEECTWPTAKMRVDRARAVLQREEAWMSTSSRVRYCVDQEVAQDLLRKHEDCKRVLDADVPPQFVLHKPRKRTTLLQNALTNVNGDDWRRQRPIVQRALNNRVARKHAAAIARQVILSKISISKTWDARQLALQVAAQSIAVAVVSADYAEFIVKPLSDLYQETLRPIHGNVELASELSSVVQDTVETISRQPADPTSACLAQSLLEQEPKLSRREVLSNIHSALLAGTQTIATTLTGALLHLASASTAEQASSKAICHETLRILPPVASVPRCRFNDDALESPVGVELVMDLLAFAHASEDDESWKFCPHSSTKSAAWGIGERSCPAGSLSVDALSAALEALMNEYEWNMKSGKDWLDTVSYTPTLQYNEPLLLAFRNKRELKQ